VSLTELLKDVIRFAVLYCECMLVDMMCCRKILQYMKSQNLMLNETIFNALVKGHVKKGFVYMFQHFCCSICFVFC